ncbi:hypothetical protein [Reinekea sp. G2M2-21]|uniref:hypothetical protein n=1 Tax=Reinekea sp. G2M2-21 TaxID=2788942 RepID=UPI0018A97DD0|nr:hypothetical protein [Reinekea sp. G2M2-21]
MSRQLERHFYNRFLSRQFLKTSSHSIADTGVNNHSVASALADLIGTSQRIQGHGCPCKRRACRDERSSDRSKKVAIKEEHQSGRQKGGSRGSPLGKKKLNCLPAQTSIICIECKKYPDRPRASVVRSYKTNK